MSSIEDLFGTDEALERDGVWIDFGPAGSFLIAAAGPGNPKFQKSAERVLRPVRKQIEAGVLANDAALKLSARIYAEAVVLDWKGVTFKGEKLDYSREAAETLLLALPRLLTALQKMAEDVSTFQAEKLESEAKN